MPVPARYVGHGDRRPCPPRPRGFKGLWSFDELPRARVWMTGPHWRRLFGVQQVPLVDVAPDSARFHRPGKQVLLFTFEDDVRELVLEEIRPGVYAEWSDPREMFR